MEQKDNFKLTEDILHSFDDIQRATAPDFFYTRLQAKMEASYTDKTKPNLILRPILITTCLIFFIVCNMLTISYFKNNKNNTETVKKTATIDDFASAYQLENSNF